MGVDSEPFGCDSCTIDRFSRPLPTLVASPYLIMTFYDLALDGLGRVELDIQSLSLQHYQLQHYQTGRGTCFAPAARDS